MKHIDEGTLQAWFDGELASDKAAKVSAHVNACALCGEAARVLEAESSLVTNALAAEFAQPIPTERLRSRIELAVSASQVNTAPDKAIGWREAVRDFFNSFSPRSLAYASIAAVVLMVGVFGFAYLKRDRVTLVAVQQPTNEIKSSTPKSSPEVAAAGPEAIATLTPHSISHPKSPNPSKITSVAKETNPIKAQERKYEQTIASLKATIQKNPPLRPTIEVEYQHSLALIDHAIETTREAAKMNPKDPQAAQFLLAAYQSKVDLMNQIADARSFGK